MNRRNFLKISGGGVILAAGGAGLFAATRTPNDALKPWELVGSYDDPRKNALSHAILAPNPHNRQPWIISLDGDDGLTLHFDTEKQLPHTDPFDRQLTIGLGCFLELMRMAANADGYDVDVTLFPEGENMEGLDNRPIARATFAEGTAVRDPLFDHMLSRRSNKEPYDTSRTIPPETLARILTVARQTQIGGSIDTDDITYWRQLTTQALTIEIETPHTFKESVDLMRIGKAEINANPDGIDFSGALFETLAITGVMTREALLDTSSTGFAEGMKAVLANTKSAMGHLWMVTQTNTRRDQIAAGADWLRVNLACTAEGLGFQPLSQALQEYPEMAELYGETHERLASEGGTVQMLSRIGYGPEIAVSPRWPIEAKIGTA
ncbi:Acg family FMN-binding oxidoreductase [Halocynthiibacter styelae]|uniref:Twin-arginine translocation pathway signal protein n=1 Tax=Halocynthiibacter styelae TaxID=2761955 RepID=A0A8J7IM96_9RHOB|nr:twin-arginine translocation pathway signal protein [Paenihalocynthiibacter styelae]MBI1493171.1 twin-arginine translocation pathway signal protein [Paenihalocynthiibacter styelae]